MSYTNDSCHIVSVRTRWRSWAHCLTCGWDGPRRQSWGDAFSDAAAHRALPSPPPSKEQDSARTPLERELEVAR